MVVQLCEVAIIIPSSCTWLNCTEQLYKWSVHLKDAGLDLN